jgi:hypothetical protein
MKIIENINKFSVKYPDLVNLFFLVLFLIAFYVIFINMKSETYTELKSKPINKTTSEMTPSIVHQRSDCKCLCSGSMGTVNTCINKKQTLINYKNGLNENANFAELQKKIGGPVWKNNTCFGSY